MDTKTCTKCSLTFPATTDYFHRAKDKLVSYCKQCAKIYASTDAAKAKRKECTERWRASEEGSKKRQAWLESDRRKELSAKNMQKYLKSDKAKANNKRAREKNPDGVKAREKVGTAVKNGTLPRVKTLLCSRCHNRANHYHHHLGYSPENWLDVIPLCAKCHKKEHLAHKD